MTVPGEAGGLPFSSGHDRRAHIRRDRHIELAGHLDGFLEHVNWAYQLIMKADAALNASPPMMTIEEPLTIERRDGALLARATDTLSEVAEAQGADVATG